MKAMTISTIKNNWKRYLVSSVITFLAAFLFVIYPELDTLSTLDLKDGTAIGLLVSGIRVGIKAVIEYLLSLMGHKVN